MKSKIEDDGFETVHPPITRSDILDQAKTIITKDRAATHGDAEDSFARIADAWSWWLKDRLEGPIDTYDVAMMMTLFKIARAKGNPTNSENPIDGCGYLALAAEMAGRSERHRKEMQPDDLWFA